VHIIIKIYVFLRNGQQNLKLEDGPHSWLLATISPASYDTFYLLDRASPAS